MAEKKDDWTEPAENPASFEKIKAQLEEHKVKYTLTKHDPVRTSEEAA